EAGYYGRDSETQRARLVPHDLQERLDLGQLLAGSPDTVLRQIDGVRRELDAGILEIIFSPVGRDKTLKALELFGRHVLPRMQAL
ncbi:MAG: hypothetical protein JOZ39_12730, partial [Chloroflexi bacterium]|nr:hypothetical protein [Chloroflexota bacterium]